MNRFTHLVMAPLTLLLAVTTLTGPGATTASAAQEAGARPAQQELRFFDGEADPTGALWRVTYQSDRYVLSRTSPAGAVRSYPEVIDPGPVTIASDGAAWLTGTIAGSGPLVRIDASTRVARSVGDLDQLDTHGILAASTGGRMWVGRYADEQADQIVDLALVSAAGVVTPVAGAPIDTGEFVTPRGNATDGALWILDVDGVTYDFDRRVTRVRLDGATSSIELQTGSDEDVSSLAFAADGALHYTTYSEGQPTISGSSGGGLGQVAGGSNTWRPRTSLPPRDPYDDGTYSYGPLPFDIQSGPGGWTYFTEDSARGYRVVRFLSDGYEQYVVPTGFGYLGPRVGGSYVWLRGAATRTDQLFARRTLDRTALLTVRPKGRFVRFTGRVKASERRCRAAVVELRRVRPGDDQVVRRGRTSGTGTITWTARRAKVPTGTYYLQAAPLALDDNLRTCRGDSSPTRRLRAVFTTVA